MANFILVSVTFQNWTTTSLNVFLSFERKQSKKTVASVKVEAVASVKAEASKTGSKSFSRPFSHWLSNRFLSLIGYIFTSAKCYTERWLDVVSFLTCENMGHALMFTVFIQLDLFNTYDKKLYPNQTLQLTNSETQLFLTVLFNYLVLA